jgi:hypothetical protein
MAAPITYKRLVLSGDKAKETADEVKAKMSKEWKKDFPDGKLDIKSGVEGKMVIDIKTKESSAASLASKIKDIATRNKVTTVTKDKPTLKAVKENDTKKPQMTDDELMKKIKSSLSFQVSGGKKGKPGLQEGPMDKRLAVVFFKYKDKSFPMDYKPGSMFARFVNDLERSGAFSSDDEVSDFMSSDEFFTYANKFGVEIEEPTNNDMLSLAPKEPINPQDMIPGRAQGDVNPNAPHRSTDIYELLKTGKVKKSVLKEIIKNFKK